MTSIRTLHLAAELAPGPEGPPVTSAARTVALARLAEAAGLDFLTHDDSFARPGLDALAVLARVAPRPAPSASCRP